MKKLHIPTSSGFMQDHAPVALAILLFFVLVLIPVEFYIMGEGYGYGIRGICYKYQVSYLGESFIPISYEISYILSGLVSGKSADAIIVWSAGALVFGTATMLSWFHLLFPKPALRLSAAAGIIGGCVLFLVSDIIQYGPFFSGPAGIALPFAIPLVLLLGWLVYRMQNFEDER